MKKIQRLLMILALTMMFIPLNAHDVQAKGAGVSTGNVAKISPVSDEGKPYDPNGELPSVSIQEANDWADRKGQDATSFLQVGGQWFSIVIFIVSAIMTLIGAVGGRASKGLIGIFFSIVMYAGITFAPTILDFFSQWLGTK